MIPEGCTLASREELDARLRPFPITKPDGYNARTGYPERGGIFCCRAFGPLDDDRCLCGKYEGEDHRGTTCEKCGVDVTRASVRAERFGRIELAVPVVHPWLAVKAAETIGASPEDLGAIVPLADRIDRSFGETFAKEVPMLTLLPVLPPGARPVTWRERDPQTTKELTRIFHQQKHLSFSERRFFSVHDLKQHTHEVVLGGTNRRYARVVERNERLRAFRDKGAPTPVLLVEEAELFSAVTTLFGANRWTSADHRNKPASIAGRLEHAEHQEDLDRELLAAAIIRR